MSRKRVGVLISGRGSNLQALIEACKDPAYPAEIVLVIANVADAQGLARAEAAAIPALAISHKDFASREAFDAALDRRSRRPASSCSAMPASCGCTRRSFVEAWRDRHLNIHPSLLPAFKGLDTHARVLDAGCKISGCTVHFVRTEMDAGPIVAQAAVPVVDGDTADSLAARVLAAEHRLYPHALALVASGSGPCARRAACLG